MLTELQRQEFLEFRKYYLKVGELLETNQVLYEKILQNQVEIKSLITKGWGY